MSKSRQYNLEHEPSGPKEYLTKRFPGANRQNVTTISQDCEWYCKHEVCHNRVTLSPSAEVEYGHSKDCPHSVWGGGNNE